MDIINKAVSSIFLYLKDPNQLFQSLKIKFKFYGTGTREGICQIQNPFECTAAHLPPEYQI